MAVVRWLRPPPYKRLSLANKRAFSIIAEIPIAELEMKRRISVREREDCTLVAWYGYLCAPRAGGAYDSHHRTAGIAGRARRRGSRFAARGAGAAGRQGLAHRHAGYHRRGGQIRRHQCVPARPRGAWIYRGKEPHHRLSLGRRPPRALSGTRSRALSGATAFAAATAIRDRCA